MYLSSCSLEPHPLEFALIPPLKASLISVRSYENVLDDNSRGSNRMASGGGSNRRMSRVGVTFNRADRRKSVSTPAISRLTPNSRTIHSPGTIPENRLLHQSSLRARSCSPLGRARTSGSKGRLSDGSSFGDLMNSGEFRTRGSSIRCCSPIALSMVKSVQSSTDSFCPRRLDHCPTIAIDSPDCSMCLSLPSSANLLHCGADDSDVSSFGSCTTFLDCTGGLPGMLFTVAKPAFINEDGSICGMDLSMEQRKELHEYLTCKQKHLAQKAMVNILYLKSFLFQSEYKIKYCVHEKMSHMIFNRTNIFFKLHVLVSDIGN